MERDEQIYAYVMDELENGIKNEALWIKAYAMSEGQEEKIKPKYMQYRVEDIKQNFLENNIDYSDYSDYTKEGLSKSINANYASLWMINLWEWADKRFNNIDTEENILVNLRQWDRKAIPRKRHTLWNLKTLNLNQDNIWNEGGWRYGNSEGMIDCRIESLNFRLTYIPKEIGCLTNLTDLDVGNNELIELPKEIGKLSNLLNLYLGCNKLMKLPKEVGSLTSLIKLELQYNNLTKLPKEICKLYNLKSIHLNGNKNLTLTSEQIEWLKSLNDNGCDVLYG